MSGFDNALMEQRRLALKAEIESLINRVPPGFSGWSMQRTVMFKEAVKHGRASVNAKRPSIPDMNEALSKLKVYWSQS